MKSQKGQATVEFAFVVSFFFMMCFGMIYGGILFMDYLQYNNAARMVARVIAIEPNSDKRTEIATDFKDKNSKYINPLTKLYSATPDVDINNTDVTVTIKLTLNEEGLLGILSRINFPPKNLTAVKVTMPLEHKLESAGEGQE